MPVFLSHKNHQLEYFVFGEGSKWMIAFHGFGRSADDFKVFENYIGNEYKILSINLFHHGNSKLTSEKKLTKNDIKSIFEKLFDSLNISEFSLMGYSIGGRMVFTLLELFPEKVNAIQLFAPDGLVKKHWINFLNFTLFGKLIYKVFTDQGQLIIPVLNFIKFAKLIDPKLHQFIFINIETYQKRKFVTKVWLTYRNIFPDVLKIKKILHQYQTPFDLYIGIYDQVITLKQAKYFIEKIHCPCLKLTLLETGHNLITEKTLNTLFDKRIKQRDFL